MKYRTQTGDVLDQICHQHYGETPYSIEAVYMANPGLAKIGPVLPSGVMITLPALDVAQVAPPTLRLWD